MGTSRKEETSRRDWSPLDLFKALPLILKLLIAIFGGGTAITIVIVIGSQIGGQPGVQAQAGQPSYIYPASVQQGWLNDCESISDNFHTVPICECELSYFENHVSAAIFEQDYGDSLPGVVPSQLDGAEAACPPS
jgi:hypothetical protein